jgi:hypothetical protein
MNGVLWTSSGCRHTRRDVIRTGALFLPAALVAAGVGGASSLARPLSPRDILADAGAGPQPAPPAAAAPPAPRPPAAPVRLCVDRVLSVRRRIAAARRAIEENPLNEPKIDLPPGVLLAKPEMAMLIGRVWKRRTLRVRFLDGVPEVRDKVADVAKQWSQFADMKFNFGNDPLAEIRISFAEQGRSWSHTGTEALEIERDKPTMNFGWLTPDSTDDDYSVVLHEFGHALGCVHEHQSPAGDIQWNKPVVYDYYAELGWSPQMVDENVFARYSGTRTQYSQFDTKSIMLYPVPKAHTLNGFEVGWNTTLSDTDKTFMANTYQKPA